MAVTPIRDSHDDHLHDGHHDDDHLHEDRHRVRGTLREEPGKPIPRDPHDDAAAPHAADVTPSSKGLGAVYGDAERTPNPGPVRPPGPIDQAAMDAVEAEYAVETTAEGERYLTPRDGDTETTTTDDFPDRRAGG
jgi:hypothetical protein